jgi:hypothetical protein
MPFVLTEIPISEITFATVYKKESMTFRQVNSVPPIDNDPCGYAMLISRPKNNTTPAYKERPTVTTIWPASAVECHGKSRFQHRAIMGESHTSTEHKRLPAHFCSASSFSRRESAAKECPLSFEIPPQTQVICDVNPVVMFCGPFCVQKETSELIVFFFSLAWVMDILVPF